MQIKQRLVDYYRTPAGKEPAGLGQFGKTRNVGDGVWELKIDYGPGYRVYYGMHNDELILILMAGSKRTQTADIKKARAYWTEWMERNI